MGGSKLDPLTLLTLTTVRPKSLTRSDPFIKSMRDLDASLMNGVAPSLVANFRSLTGESG